MRLGLQCENRLKGLNGKVVRLVLAGRSKLLSNRSVKECTVVTVCRNYMIRILPGSLLYKTEE